MNHNKITPTIHKQNQAHDIYQTKLEIDRQNYSSYFQTYNNYHNAYQFYNNMFQYPFMQPSSFYSCYPMPSLARIQPYSDIENANCRSFLVQQQKTENKIKTIKNEDQALIIKIEPSQCEQIKKNFKFEQKRSKKLKIQKNQILESKRKHFKTQKFSAYTNTPKASFLTVPQSIQEEQYLLQLFKQITTIFANEQYCEKVKQRWMVLFKMKFVWGELVDITKFLQILCFKFTNFKKTKQELIKYIIRKIYHNLKEDQNYIHKPQYIRLQEFHYKNLNNYKAMNVEFLKKQFSNPLFVNLYKKFYHEIDEIIENDNEKRIKRFNQFILKCWKKQDLGEIYKQRKIPWIRTYKQKSKKICLDLLLQYEHLSYGGIFSSKEQERSE